MTVQALFVAPNLGVGGAERQWSSLLRSLPEENVRTRLLTLDGTGRFFDEVVAAGVPASCVGWRSRWGATKIPSLLAQAPRADVVVARGFSAVLVGSLIAAAQRVPLVVSEHTDYRTLPPVGYRRWLLPRIAARVRHVVAVSETQLPGLTGQGYRPETVHFIPNGVPPVAGANRSWRSTQGLSDDDIVVTVGAALRPEKRVSDFIRVIAEVRRRGLPVAGVVAGGGPALDDYRRLAEAHGGSTRFLGAVENMNAVLAGSEIACLVSEHEVMSMFLLEALAHGLPIVATDVGATRELCRPGLNGFLTSVADLDRLTEAVARLAASRELRHGYGAESLRLFEREHDAHLMTHRYANYFREVVECR